jgi:hypothetical protein
MSDSVWYYAQNDQERGPVSAAELRSLAAAGKLRGSDLVWKEGMEVWTAAAQVKGLLPETAPPPANASDSATRNRPQGRRDSPREPASREARWIDGPPADDAVQVGAPRVPMTAVGAPASRMIQPAAEPRPTSNFLDSLPKYLRLTGIGLVAVGLLLVLAARGCETLADRYTRRVSALASAEPERFQQDWNRERRELQAAVDALQAKSNPTQTERNLLSTRQTELRTLNERKLAEQNRLSQGRWAELRGAASTAAEDNRAWGFWRGVIFVFGTFVLVPGLLVVGFVGQNAERWMCLVMLGVVMFSLYVGDNVWSSLLNK